MSINNLYMNFSKHVMYFKVTNIYIYAHPKSNTHADGINNKINQNQDKRTPILLSHNKTQLVIMNVCKTKTQQTNNMDSDNMREVQDRMKLHTFARIPE